MLVFLLFFFLASWSFTQRKYIQNLIVVLFDSLFNQLRMDKIIIDQIAKLITNTMTSYNDKKLMK